MSRDFRQELEGVRCFDRKVQHVADLVGAPAVDCILQNREELIAFCHWLESHDVRSYLEVGIWTGRHISTLQRLFDFRLVAACDVMEASSKFGLPVSVPDSVILFEGSSRSPQYVQWRHKLGPIDLVFIDGDHTYDGVWQDFEINRLLPNRYLAFHDVTGADIWTEGVGKFWHELSVGYKHEIILPHLELGLTHSTMGIGIWSETPIE